MEGYIFDLESEKDGKIKLLIKDKKKLIVEDEFDHYIYLIPEKSPEKTKKKLEKNKGIKKVEIVEKIDLKKKIKVLKISPKDSKARVELRRSLKEYGQTREGDISAVYRYLIDKDLYPMRFYDFNIKDGKLISFKRTRDKVPKLKICAFDIEAYNKEGIPNPSKDSLLLIGYQDAKESIVFYWTKGKSSEKETIQKFVNTIKKKDVDVIVGYNSSGFDFPFLKGRAKQLDVKLDFGVDGSSLKIMRRGIINRADIFGRIHLDAYDAVEFLTRIDAMKLPKKDLEAVYKEFFGKEKLDIDSTKIYEFWEKGGKDLKTLIEYNRQDAKAAYEIGKEILPLYIELSRIVGIPTFEASKIGTSQMVGWLLIREAYKNNIIVPKRPEEEKVRERMRNPIKGAFVKMPESGLHERIVVCDFRSLYPSIIITHNVGPSTLNCKCCKNPYVSPMGHKFCKKRKGLFPKILKELIEARAKVKAEMKKHKRGSPEYKALHYKQWALKIVANSAYGYLGYGRAKWYSRESAESITAWARHFIHDTIDKAKKEDFHVLYADTDSVFLKLENKTIGDAKKFVSKVNKDLPKGMELEFEGFYPRGIFVTRREGKAAAKKRYALIREDGTVEIKGFEFVRRDWANVAKDTQEKVIEAVLKEGKPKKAVKIVSSVIQDLKKGKVDLDDLVILTQIVRRLGSYEQQAPHVKAAKKLQKAGYKVSPGYLIEYVVVKGKGSISDRAIPIQLLGNKKYDPDYYIEHQILPAVMKILREVGVKEEDLKYKGKQAGLGKWT